MTTREDIGTGRLAYSCNCGWLDLGHLNPENAHDPHVGASNLWRQIKAGGVDAKMEWCDWPRSGFAYAPPPPFMSPSRNMCGKDGLARFSDGATGFRVIFKMSQGGSVLGLKISEFIENAWLVRHDLTTDQKKSVALAIFQSTSLSFEEMQFRQFQASGFSQEDLVSNLIGFYVAVGEVTKADALTACHLVSKETSYAVWDRDGAVGHHKNRTFEPQFSADTGVDDSIAGLCKDECMNEPRKLPAAFSKITPAVYGRNFMRLPRLNGL